MRKLFEFKIIFFRNGGSETDEDPAPSGMLVMEGETDHGVNGTEQEP